MYEKKEEYEKVMYEYVINDQWKNDNIVIMNIL